MNTKKEALGRKSRELKERNRQLVYMTIAKAKKPLSFSELLSMFMEKKQLSRASLSQHLKLLEKEGLIYRHMFEPTEALPSEIGKIVYLVKEAEMEKFLLEAVETNFTIADLVEDENLRKKLRRYAEEIAKAIFQYLNELRATREQGLKAELERIKKK